LFHISVWGGWSFVWGAKHTKAPRGDGTVLIAADQHNSWLI